MKSTTFARLGTLVAAMALAACADQPSAPTAAPLLEVVRPAVSAPALLRTKALDQDLTVSAVIGPDGGQIRIRDAGFKLIVPEGAVSAPTTFTVTAVAGTLVAYEFGPHGMVFNHPLKFEQSLKKTNFWDLPRSARLEGGYFASRANLDVRGGRATIDEFRPATTQSHPGGRSTVKFEIEHFSGYLVATGRSAPR